MKNTCDISIVLPLYNEAENLLILKNEIQNTLEKLDLHYEIIFVNDGSTDSSWEIIKHFSNENTSIIGVKLSRNFGHQIALFAGIKEAKGEIVITMDSDLQHPVHLIPTLIEKFAEGFDIVNTNRKDGENTSWFKKMSAKAFYTLINVLSETKIQHNAADFRLMNRKVVDAFLELPEKDRFNRGLFAWMGFQQASIEYLAEKRFANKSKYSFLKMLGFAFDGITSFSAKPLRISFFLGIFISLIGLIYAIYAVIQHFYGNTQPGWTSILVSILILGGFQLISIGIVGEYLARIFKEAKNRPLYFIAEKTNDSKK
jgi:polyisoprenyl-phosphate glycosyltransferase